jgi:hypothetical protein
MTTNTCCHSASISSRGKSTTRRMLVTTKWIAPSVILALLPKCPMCLAAYIALATGFGISMPVAAWIRTGLLLTCLSALAWFTVSALRRRDGRAADLANSWVIRARRLREDEEHLPT